MKPNTPTTLVIEGYTAYYMKTFKEVPSGWPPRFVILQVARPDGTEILPTTFAAERGIVFIAQFNDMRAVRCKIKDVIWWDTATPEQRMSTHADSSFDWF